MKRGHDLSGVMKFATSPAWGEHLGEALGDHRGLAMEEFDFEADELADIVGDHWAGVLWGCAFEGLLTRTLQPDRNICGEPIRTRGWHESGPTKIYQLGSASGGGRVGQLRILWAGRATYKKKK